MKRIQCEKIKEYKDDKEYSLLYYLSNTIQVDSFVSILHAFETERICFAECFCSGFDGDGHSRYCAPKTIEAMNRIGVEFGRPYIQFNAVFCDRETRKYCFSISSAVNSNVMEYCIASHRLNKQY